LNVEALQSLKRDSVIYQPGPNKALAEKSYKGWQKEIGKTG